MIDTIKPLQPTGAHLRLILGLILGLAPLTADAATDKRVVVDRYKVTNAEKLACTADAIRLCMDVYPSEEKLFSCMNTNRASLSPTCRVAFDAGVKRRHLHF